MMADFKCVVCKHHYTPSDSQPCDNCEYIGDGRYSAYSSCTNADRVRSMRDGELANFFDDIETKAYMSEYRGVLGWLEWLKQAATDG